MVIYRLNIFCSDIPLICKPPGVEHKVNEASRLPLLVLPLGSQSSAAPLYMHPFSKERDNTHKKAV